jgi:hypothetical protein
MLDVVGDDDVMGEDIVVGANVRSRRGPGGMRRLTVAKPAWMKNATPQGISTPEEELDFLPFTSEPLVFGGSPIGALITFPQRPFRGERLILSAVKSNAGVVTDATGQMVIAPAIFVGAVQVGATQGATPFGAFVATAFGVRLSFPVAGQGTRIAIPFASVVALVLGDRIDVSGTLIGRSVR